MQFIKTNIPDVFIIEPKIFGDDRGYFFESFNQKEFEEHIGKINFIQDNESKSSKGVLRGLHFQRPPYTQSKLLRCIEGEVLDVAVDLRQDSPTYKQHLSVVLSGDNKKQVFIPKGFAHGFLVLSETATIAYKVDQYYAPDYDSGIAWNDIEINIDWGVSPEDVQLSEKDKNLKALVEIEHPF
ncbi:dTDP-4-dehydrorhamnose 3,5-epimerase [Ancylomarina salipaludis]|uniref:dTDP-4-dehydrorhamnose 3,5-epimerase n=1 Tax=Ancylomarina salipaludis TaxID=2501299 RepID=A0A4Q1JJG5_9BACT|nr:dTDP-4-dehydrorhamnose 3,5-epimerase [Ancylomarina salipaludis]RXQ91466.1 dTDP-4-dehydrorhamnose 3,5-epimerase [Ancylomarina salipaludis]